jgi:hypothetical protein
MQQQEAFLAQARSDYVVFEVLGAKARAEVPECHVVHYFQMATEKLAKALLTRLGKTTGRSHRAFSRMASVLKKRQDVLRALGYVKPAEAARFIARTVPLFEQIEDLCPAIANDLAQQRGLQWDQGQNVEYPWWELHPQSARSGWRPRTGLSRRSRHAASGTAMPAGCSSLSRPSCAALTGSLDVPRRSLGQRPSEGVPQIVTLGIMMPLFRVQRPT